MIVKRDIVYPSQLLDLAHQDDVVLVQLAKEDDGTLIAEVIYDDGQSEDLEIVS